VSARAEGDEAACLDPSQLATGTNDAILHVVFAPTLAKRLVTALFHSCYVVGVHAGQAYAACDLVGAFGKAVDGRVAVGNLHDLCACIIGIAADEAGL
jgi:hypothetical protein